MFMIILCPMENLCMEIPYLFVGNIHYGMDGSRVRKNPLTKYGIFSGKGLPHVRKNATFPT